MCIRDSSLFETEPTKWGLRGDPYMWRHLKEQFSQTPLPDSADALEKLLKDAFYSTIYTESEQERQGSIPLSHEHFFIKRFAQGGMSSGRVDAQFWETEAIPMLIERYRKHHAN